MITSNYPPQKNNKQMKQTVKTYVGLAVSLPFAVVGGALLIVGAVCNVIASMALGQPQNARDYMDVMKS